MAKIIVDINEHLVYKHLPTDGLIAFDYKQVVKILQTLSKHGKVFHQIPIEEKLSGHLLEKNANGGNYEVVRLCDLDHLPLSTRIWMDTKKLLGFK